MRAGHPRATCAWTLSHHPHPPRPPSAAALADQLPKKGTGRVLRCRPPCPLTTPPLSPGALDG